MSEGKDDGKNKLRKEQSYRVRKKIQDSIEQAHEEHRRNLMRRRIELARSGVRAYQLHRISEAVSAFHTYIHILEEWKGVAEGGLHPGLFDQKKDLPELLLISGVYWDLVKLYDRTSSPAKQKDFAHYMNKYIIFSKNLPYQPLCAETLRKYIGNEKTIHKEAFQNAYKLLGGGGCFVATALSDVSDEATVERLRGFRDVVLDKSRGGRAFIAWYYRNGPGIARRVNRLPRTLRRALGAILDVLGWLVSP